MAWIVRAFRRSARDRGAGLVEYGLAVSLLLVGSIGVIQTLEDGTSDEVDNQAECLSERPPPPSCQATPLVPTTTTTTPPSTSTTSPPVTTPPPVASFPGDFSTPSVDNSDPNTFGLASDLVILDEDGNPVAGLEGTIRWVITQPSARAGQFGFEECVTDASGLCAFDFTVPSDVTQFQLDLVTVFEGTTQWELPDPCQPCQPSAFTLSAP